MREGSTLCSGHETVPNAFISWKSIIEPEFQTDFDDPIGSLYWEFLLLTTICLSISSKEQ